MNLHVFAGNPLDRSQTQRRDQQWLDAQATNPHSRFLPLWQLNVLLHSESETRLGDGWMPAGRPPDDRVKGYMEQLHRYLEEASRDRKNFGIDPWISIQGLNKDEWRRRVGAWRALGATHVAVNTMGAGFTSPQAHIDAIRSFRDILD